MSDSSSAQNSQFIVDARSGNPAALGMLLNRYRNYLRILARVHIDRRLQAKADPSDLVQETWAQAHRDFPQFRGTTEAEFLQWMRKIMATKGGKLARRFYGTKGRDVRLEQEIEIDLEQTSVAIERALSATGCSVGEQAIRSESVVALADSIADLPESYREVIVLYHFEGLTAREVADRMDRSEYSVQKLWARALVKLREKMKTYE